MSADKNKDDIVRKLKALLRKADPSANTTQEEMESAMALAQRLALKYQLDLASIDPFAEEFEVNESTFLQSVRINNEVKFAALVIQKFFNVSVYYHSRKLPVRFFGANKSRHEVKVVGTDTDKAIAKYIFDYLIRQFRDLWNEARRSGRYPTKFPEGYQARHSFMLGLVKGVLDRLNAEKAAQCQERALMVISNKLAQRKRFLEEKHPDMTEGDDIPQAGWNQEAYDEGVEKGKAIQVRPGMTAPVEKAKKGAIA